MMARAPAVGHAQALNAPAARLRGVRKRFGYRDVLRGVTLEIPRGGCFVICGPNGAGKSTLLRILATQWTSTAGDVEVLGYDVKRDPLLVRAQVGIVFHDAFLRRELTLDENLRFTGDLLGLDRETASRRTGELLERFGLAHRRKDAVGIFSQGLLKRASLARSLLGDPELWILDEPFSGLDPDGQELLERWIGEFSASDARRTVVLVTHQAALGRRLASASVRLEDGAVTRMGPGGAAMDPAARVPAGGEGATV